MAIFNFFGAKMAWGQILQFFQGRQIVKFQEFDKIHKMNQESPENQVIH